MTDQLDRLVSALARRYDIQGGPRGRRDGDGGSRRGDEPFKELLRKVGFQ